jgi:hypothetical protein
MTAHELMRSGVVLFTAAFLCAPDLKNRQTCSTG